MEQNKTASPAEPGAVTAPPEKAARPAREKPAPQRRVGSLTLGICLIAAGTFFLCYFFVPGFPWQRVLEIAPAAGLILLGAEVLFFAARPGQWKYDFVSVFICLVLMAMCFGLALLPAVWDQVDPQVRQIQNRLSDEALAELYAACKANNSDIAIEDMGGRLYLDVSGAKTLDEVAAMSPSDYYLNVTVQLFGPYDSKEAFAQDCRTLTTLAQQCTVPPDVLHFEWQAADAAVDDALDTGRPFHVESYALTLSGDVQMDWTADQMTRQIEVQNLLDEENTDDTVDDAASESAHEGSRS